MPVAVKLLPPVRVKISVTVSSEIVRSLVANETPPIERLPLMVAFRLVRLPFVKTRPEVDPHPKPTLMTPTLGTLTVELPFRVNVFATVFAVIFRPVVLNVEPPRARLLLTVILTLVSEPLVRTSPVELAPPKMTLRLPIFA